MKTFVYNLKNVLRAVLPESKRKPAFTLAEVLITLGIIGIVAAMTMPALIGKYRSKVAVTQLKKMYSVMSQAMLYTVQEDGDYSSLSVVDYSDESIQNWYNTALKPYIKITKECFNKAGCWADTGTKTLDGGSPNYDMGAVGIGYQIVTFSTIDGYNVCMDVNSNISFMGVSEDSVPYIAVYVDVNGNKPPNVIGKDTFVFVFSNKGFVPAGRNATDSQVNSNCSKTGRGYFCFEKIMRNGWEIDKENLW